MSGIWLFCVCETCDLSSVVTYYLDDISFDSLRGEAQRTQWYNEYFVQNNLLKNDTITSFGVLFWIFMFHIVYLRHVIVCPILEVILFSCLWESFAFCIDSCDFFFLTFFLYVWIICDWIACAKISGFIFHLPLLFYVHERKERGKKWVHIKMGGSLSCQLDQMIHKA